MTRQRKENAEDSANAPPCPGRRAMLAGLAAAPFAAGLAAAQENSEPDVDATTGATPKWIQSDLEKLIEPLPKGGIGDLKMSRLILGNNLIGGWAHARDLLYVSTLFMAYNTSEKVFETLYLAEQAGIDTMMLVNNQYEIFHQYQKLTKGKMQTMCQIFPGIKDPFADIDRAIDNGATTLYVHGGAADRFLQMKRVDIIAQALEHIQKQGYQGGVGAHSLLVPMACEKAGLTPDYYVKTCHHDQYWSATPRENRKEFSVDRKRYADHNEFHDNMFDLFPEKTIEFMATVKCPWIGFKVLAAGAIHPEDGFNYAFQNGADFICVGMFDFQIVDDVNIATRALGNSRNRPRPWYA
jgi:hypothetical protein